MTTLGDVTILDDLRILDDDLTSLGGLSILDGDLTILEGDVTILDGFRQSDLRCRYRERRRWKTG